VDALLEAPDVVRASPAEQVVRLLLTLPSASLLRRGL